MYSLSMLSPLLPLVPLLPLLAIIYLLLPLLLPLLPHSKSSSLSLPLSLSHIPPMHPLAPYTTLYSLYLKHRGVDLAARLAAHNKLGPIIRVAPNEISVNCIEGGVKTIYGGGFEKGDWYTGFKNYGHSYMFIMQSNKHHSERKRFLSHFYSNSHILKSHTLTSILTEMLARRYIPQLRSMCSSSSPSAHNIYRLNKALFLDISAHLLFGPSQTCNFISNPQEAAFLEKFEIALSQLFWSLDAPHLAQFAEKFGWKVISPRVVAAHKEVEDLILRWCVVAKTALLSSSPSSEEPSAYELLYNALSPTTPPADLDRTIAAELLDHTLASHEISSIVLTCLMYELSLPHNSHIISHLQTELDSLSLSSPPPTPQTHPYLHAVLHETLRLYPASSGPFTRIVPKFGATLAGYHIPAGTVVGASAYTLHQNGDVFARPEEWLPERWLDGGKSEEEKKRMDRWWWAFGSGGRMCIGSHLAVRMIKAAVIATYSEFETVVVPETKVEQIPGIISHPVGHSIMLGIKKRGE